MHGLENSNFGIIKCMTAAIASEIVANFRSLRLNGPLAWKYGVGFLALNLRLHPATLSRIPTNSALIYFSFASAVLVYGPK
jgi:hypothetical protein